MSFSAGRRGRAVSITNVMDASAAPTLTFFARIDVEVAVPIDLGVVAGEHRRIVPILGGTVTGPDVSGIVLPGGADYQVLHESGRQELEAKYAIELEDGTRLSVNNLGIRSGSAEDLAAIARGERVDPARIYFRSQPRIFAGAGSWEWVNDRLFVASGQRMPESVRLDVFTVE